MLISSARLGAWSQSFSLSPEIVDGIAAVVNDQVITLGELKVLAALELYKVNSQENRKDHLFQLLENVIDQKVVISLTREKILVTEEEIEAELQDVVKKLGEDEFQKRIDHFGLGKKDLYPYIMEKVLYQKIISLRFGQAIGVTLKEIESYYETTYIPAQKKMGAEPKPMMEVLDEIESLIRKEKMGKQVSSWLHSLRRQAEVRIFADRLKNIQESR